ncbi:MAG: NADH-quinone oxidoreductase subunit A [Acidimicrobiia bacterium]|nr:NADH-quinone oxidoreductase subunit A [Acidimicrobiia bacterium]MDH3470376.1 NADH-quinone oxidoreductase subunit A [Acidimicrobiia bacterium]
MLGPPLTLADYLPLALMFLLGVGFAGFSFVFSYWISPKRPTPEKLAPYESGIVPLQEPTQRFPVKFYLVAMLFVLFDIEIVFLFAWATRYHELGWPGVAAVGIFTLLLIETLAYVWKRGALDWNIASRSRYRRVVAPNEEAA